MKLYSAGLISLIAIESNNFNRMPQPQQMQRRNKRPILESYHYINTDAEAAEIRRVGERIFMDSGAFSAYTKGATIDIHEYMNFVRRNYDIIDQVAILDAIGDPVKTWQNQKYMESNGIRPLPCFHFGEDESYLTTYIDNYEYICLGGVALAGSGSRLIRWLDHLWSKYLTNKDGTARIKVHGFAITSRTIMGRYPWYSVDSSTWAQASIFGAIEHPTHGRIQISRESPSLKIEGKHFMNFTSAEQNILLQEFASAGFDYNELMCSQAVRCIYNVLAFEELTRRFTNKTKTFLNPQTELFA